MEEGRRYFRSLDGLRGLAAYTVAVSHCTLVTRQYKELLGLSGQVGVMVFFVLSGFLMGHLYLSRPLRAEQITRFYRHRVGRVVPLYLIFVALAFALFLVNGSSWPLPPINHENLARHALFVRGDSILWTVAAEVQFYLLFPLVWAGYAAWGKTALLWLALVISVIVFLHFPQTPVVVQYLPFFLIGVAAAVLDPKTAGGMNWLFVIAMVGYVLSFPEINWALGLGGTAIWQSPAYMLLMPVLVLATATSPLAAWTLGCGPARFFGTISYSVYLWHLPLLYWLLQYKPSVLTGLLLMAVFLLLTTIVATLSYWLIERPLRDLIYGANMTAGSAPITSHI
ncbi:acyltransferase [Mesorhizobium sp.]|uniref:acyltransferase family protein n=1 Tax=Mesorhizobium sp. TaxID=1871066 RepID=UPI0025B93F13|nr:acyltransferase [Mesorhizobium sp.]